jgi:predicted kinase
MVLSKDTVKDALFVTLGWSDRVWSRRVGLASMRVLFSIAEQELSDGRGVILESTFDPRFETEPVGKLLARTGCAVAQVFCTAAPTVVVERALARADRGERHPGHVDQADADELWAGLHDSRWAPLPIAGPTIRVDTTDFATISITEIAAQVLSATEPSADVDRVTRVRVPPRHVTQQPTGQPHPRPPAKRAPRKLARTDREDG